MAKSKADEWLTESGLQQITEWKSNGLTDKMIYTNMGISDTTFYDYLKKYPDFSDAYKKGYDGQVKVAENAAMKLINGYDYYEDTWERISDDRQKTRHKGDVSLTQKEWEFCLKYFNYKCAYCDCSISGTNPDSKKSNATKDHIVALENGGKMDRFNIIPVCQNCNSSKNKSDMETWYKKQKFFQDHRLKKIYDYIDLMKQTDDDVEPELVLTKRVKKHIKPDTTMLIFFLKTRCPDLYSEWIHQEEYKQSYIDGEASETKVLILPDVDDPPEHPEEDDLDD